MHQYSDMHQYIESVLPWFFVLCLCGTVLGYIGLWYTPVGSTLHGLLAVPTLFAVLGLGVALGFVWTMISEGW